jgi:hypothetical protein
VLANLQKYASVNAANVTVKYIFTEENGSFEEVEAFVSLVREYALRDCVFQISFDFKQEAVPVDAAAAVVSLHGLLADAGIQLIYVDDLLRQRLQKIHSASERVITSALAERGLEHALADRSYYDSVAVWGAGWQARRLVETSLFFQDVNVAFFVESSSARIGDRFLDRDIVAPRTLLQSSVPVLIAASQSYPAIYDQLLKLRVDESRLVKGLVL